MENKPPHVLTFHPDGSLTTIYTDRLDLSEFGPVTKTRVSLIRPLPRGRRLLFRILRRLFGDNGRVAAWTRRWPGPWVATIIGTRAQFTAPTRQECIAWEIGKLNQ